MRTAACALLPLLALAASAPLVPGSPECKEIVARCEQTTVMKVHSAGSPDTTPIFFPDLAKALLTKDTETLGSMFAFKRYGNYRGCADVAGAHHCMLSIKALQVNLGVCVPQDCRQTDYIESQICQGNNLTAVVQEAAKLYPGLKNVAQWAEEANELRSGYYGNITGYCADEAVSLAQALAPGNASFDASAFCTLAFVLLLLAGPVVALSRPGWGIDLRSSWHAFRKQRPAGSTDFLDCIRTLATFHIIVGHVFVFSIQVAGNANPMGRIFGSSFACLFVLNAFTSVDTFFWLSGFFLALGMAKQAQRARGAAATLPGALRTYLLALVHRYVRLTPLYAVVLCVWVNVTPYLGDGPMWPGIQLPGNNGGMFDYCRSYWWENLLYVTNIGNGGKELTQTCGGWTWYLTLDMQMFLLGALVLALLPLRRGLALSVGTLGLMLASSVVAGGAISRHNHAGFSSLTPGYSAVPYSLYTTLYVRWGAYAVGALTGLWWHARGKPEGLAAAMLGIGGAVLMLLNLFLPWTNMPAAGLMSPTGYVWSQAVTDVWNALQRPLYACGLSGVVLGLSACPERVLRPLNWKGWELPARLSFGAYMWHLVILIIRLYSLDAPLSYSGLSMLLDSVTVIVLAFALSFVTFMTVEAPSGALLGKLTAKAKTAPAPLLPQRAPASEGVA